ncbi:Acidic amino acid decarboxylase GADL1 [Portunus trituberculatus]|uniref:Acidic amino acid decarboxylase GADL1 n=1 Tax=Portunus trituberculatus TaxID=210409 RepID=A0A5B7J4X6_PORTR|nr:Acidic amino acid decarboxylase GADL1 [Portunus trituberculatus]
MDKISNQVVSVESLGNKHTQLVEWQDPEELKQKMSLAVREEGMTHGELLALMQQVVKYSVKTGHPYFINQLYSG